MSASNRSSRRKSLSLLLGLGAAGCMPQMGGQPSARQAEPPAVQPPHRQTAPALAPHDAEAQKTQVVVDTVNESVDRVSRILEQRAQAQQAAMDLRELRAAHESKDDTSAPTPETATTDESTIERLAAALRKGEAIDPIPAPQESTKSTAAQPSVAEQPRRSADPSQSANQGAGESVMPANLAMADEQPDYGDAQPAGMKVKPFSREADAAGALDGRPGLKLQRSPDYATSPAGPGFQRPSADPMLLVQQQFASKVESDPRDMASQLELQLLRFLKDEPVPAMEDLSALPAEDRELLAAVCDALSNFRSVLKSDVTPLGSEKARPFVEMAERISARSDLTIGSLTLCEGVRAFGLYDPIEPLQFTEGTPKKSVLYCEVDGFLAQLNDKQMWETKLSLSLQLYDERGMRVWNLPAEPVVDVSRKRRRDFFVAKVVSLPPNLRAGHYLLKASVKDVQANRIAESTIQFDVLAK